ncbi:hypothetical protein LCGC14_1473010 [marine sediment metagenome]|uniref:HNH domain-containing protein n=1 Tax=marine sediment metagenome TaxID=412755 RepID=A0A0F9JCG4_9ZZZZ
MIWNAEQYIQLRPAEGTSGESSICVPTSAGCFIGDKMKFCFSCKQVKPLSEFNKNRNRKNGHRYHCRICQHKYQREYEKTDKHKLYMLRYNQSEKGKAKNHRATSRYRQTDKGRLNSKKCSERYRIRYPERIKAKDAVHNAVLADKIPCIRTRRCYFCFEQAEQYHHYKGYKPKFWLDVIPVCKKCHRKFHPAEKRMHEILNRFLYGDKK